MDNTDHIFRSVTDLRQRIFLTEQSLQNLDTLSEPGPQRPKHRNHSHRENVSSPDSLKMQSLTLDDLSEERDSHERPFMVLREKVHSPKMPSPKTSIHASQHLQRSMSNQSLRDDFDCGSSKSASINKFADFESENLSLRRKLQQLREKNAQLVSQNHSLLNQLETGSSQLRKAQAKVEQLTEEVRESQACEKNIQERVMQLEEEQEMQVKHAEGLVEKLRKSEKHRAVSEANFETLQKEIQSLKEELNAGRQMRNRSDQDRDRAIQAAEKIRAAYEKYQKKTESQFSEQAKSESHLKESLQHLNHERETLMKTCQSLKEQVSSLMEETHRLADDNLMEKEQRCQTEVANLDLKMALAKSNHKIGEMEKLLRQSDGMKNELLRLRQVSREQADVLIGYEARLEAKKNESCDLDESRKSAQAFTEVISQLSQQLVAKEEELQSLKVSTSSPPSRLDHSTLNMSTAGDDDVVRDKNCSGSDLQLQKKRAADLEEELASIAIKLDHRAGQVEELQREMSSQGKELSAAQKEARKAKSQLTTIERQLNEKVYEVTQLMSQSVEIRDQLEAQSRALEASRKDLQLEKERSAEGEAARKEMQELHKRQCQELQLQVDRLQQKWQMSAEEQENYQKRVSTLEISLKSKDEQLRNVVEELSERRKESDMVLAELQRKTTEASDEMRQLEATLLITKQQLHLQADEAAQAKTLHESQLQQKMNRLEETERQLQVAAASLRAKENEAAALERDLSERQSLLEAANARLEDLEESLQGTDAQICSLERQLEEERNRVREEEVRHEHMQRSADNDSVKKDRLIQSLRNNLEESEKNLHNQKLNAEDLQEQLEDTRKQLKESVDVIAKLEADMKLTRDQVEEQMNRVESLEGESRQLRINTEEKDTKLRSLNSQLSSVKSELCLRDSQVEDLNVRLSSAEELLTKEKENASRLTQALRQKEDEVRGRSSEIRELECELEQRQRDLEQRVSQMTQLDMIMKEHSSGTEQRLIRLEAALKKSQVEAIQRTQQVSVLDEQLQDLKEQLREKDLQLEHAEQLQQKSRADLTRSKDDRHQLEEIITEAGRHHEQIKTENSQLKQELILSRNELQRLTQNSSAIQKEFSLSQREIEHLQAEITDLGQQIQSKEEDKQKLCEDLKISRAKEVQSRTNAEVETRKLSRQIEVLKEQHALEVANLQKTQSLIATSQKEMGTSHLLEIEKMRADEQALRDEVIQAKAESSQLKDELTAGQSLLVQANEQIIIKESESARLQAKVSSLQRSMSQLSRLDGTSYFDSQSVLAGTDSRLPEMDLSAITSSSDHDPLSLRGMLQEVNQSRYSKRAPRNTSPPPPLGSAEHLIMTKADISQSKKSTKAPTNKTKTSKKSTSAKNRIPKPKVKLGSAHPKNNPSENEFCVDNVRERLAALMGKVSTMTVEGFQSSDQDETDEEKRPKKYSSPDLPEKSFDVSSAIEHYETQPQKLTFSPASSSSASSHK